MRLIVISPPQTSHKEVNLVNQLFELGLNSFHLRKPESDKEALEAYLTGINPKYHKMIVLHNHHKLAEKYALKGIHLREPDRKRFFEQIFVQRLEELMILEKQNIRILSTSIHTMRDLERESDCFQYVFISPVFESISKEGYKPQEKWDIRKMKAHIKPQLIALGGVDANKISKANSMGFEGVAVLGAIWQNEANVLENFKIIQEKCQELEHKY